MDATVELEWLTGNSDRDLIGPLTATELAGPMQRMAGPVTEYPGSCFTGKRQWTAGRVIGRCDEKQAGDGVCPHDDVG